MFNSCKKKQEEVKKIFAGCADTTQKYEKLIELGKELPQLDHQLKTKDNKVDGCQSTMYLNSSFKEGKIYFEAESDALISSGLAAILIAVYNGETPEVILKCPPDFIEELGISASLTPSRANGLYSIHLRMKQDALNFILKSGCN